jgi:CPA1 family monovalent cation:H+ antiporter
VLSDFDLFALLLTLSALFGWLNGRFVHLPHSIALLVMGFVASLLLIALRLAFPAERIFDDMAQALRQIDFTAVVMNGMLAFLLFAGSINVNLAVLRDRAWPVATLALAGTVVSTGIVGVAFWAVTRAAGQPVPLLWALVFGALISPTDPVAVLSMLKNVSVPASLQIEMQGEALFNDGVGIALFTLLVGLAAGSGGEHVGVLDVLGHLAQEAGGGLALGLITGYLAYRAMRTIDDYAVEVLITLALVAGTYAVAQRLGTSGPLSMVAAGLLIGDRAPRDAMSDRTQGYVSALWTLIDEVLNSLLFLLIGLEVLVLRFQPSVLILASTAIPIVLIARLIAVSVPLLAFPWTERLSIQNVPFLTWAGVRGGISVALVLSLPESPAKALLLAATYAVVLFTIVVQGSTLGLVAKHALSRPSQEGRK